MSVGTDEIYHCVGVCMPDEEEAYCLGCGRPWNQPAPAQPDSTPATPEPDRGPAPA